MANRDPGAIRDFQNEGSASGGHLFGRGLHIDSHSRRVIELYLASRISDLDREITSNLSTRRPDYEWGKRIGRIMECKNILEWLDGQNSRSAAPLGASITE